MEPLKTINGVAPKLGLKVRWKKDFDVTDEGAMGIECPKESLLSNPKKGDVAILERLNNEFFPFNDGLCIKGFGANDAFRGKLDFLLAFDGGVWAPRADEYLEVIQDNKEEDIENN